MNKNVLPIAVAVTVIGFLFYWFQYRPSQIRSYCSWSVRWEEGKSQCGDSAWSGKCYDTYYERCLQENGLE